MRVVHIVAFMFATAWLVSLSTASHAQHPICAPPSPSQTYLAICKPGLSSIQASAFFLTRFSVDHLFKPPQKTFSYTLVEFAAPFVGRQLAEDEDLYDAVRNLPAIKFARLDNSTGTLVAIFEESLRSLNGRFDDDDQQSRLSLELPARLEGGYWRAPDVLQMAFWTNHRPSIRFEFENRTVIESEISCISMSADSLKIDLVEDDQPGILVSLGSCEE